MDSVSPSGEAAAAVASARLHAASSVATVARAPAGGFHLTGDHGKADRVPARFEADPRHTRGQCSPVWSSRERARRLTGAAREHALEIHAVDPGGLRSARDFAAVLLEHPLQVHALE